MSKNISNVNTGLFLEQTLPKCCYLSSTSDSSVSLFIPYNHLYKVLFFLKHHSLSQYKVLSDVTAVDWLGRTKDKIDFSYLSTFSSDLRSERLLSLESRFCLVYNLSSPRYETRIILKTFLPQSASIESMTSLYKSANWWEREVWDMFGIPFLHHPDLRRLLTDYGFRGHPLRKDFPLSGYTETRYDENSKKVVTESVELSQEYRFFNMSSPWEA